MLRYGLTGTLLLFAATASAQSLSTVGPISTVPPPSVAPPPSIAPPPNVAPSPIGALPSPTPTRSIPSAVYRPVRPDPAPAEPGVDAPGHAAGAVDLRPGLAPLVDPGLVLIRMPEGTTAVVCDGKVVTVAASASRSGKSEERCFMTKRAKAEDSEDRFGFADDQLGIDNDRVAVDRADVVMDGFWEHVLKDPPPATR